MDEGILTQLAFQLARQQNPEGRLSEKDIEMNIVMIKKLMEEGNMPPLSMMIDTTTSAYGDAGKGREVPPFLREEETEAPPFLREEAKANGGRIGYQTGGITMANTLQQNLAANQAQAANVQAILNAARKQASLPSVQTTSAPTSTTSAPAPSITKSSPTPTTVTTSAPSMQQVTSQMMAPTQNVPPNVIGAGPGFGGLTIEQFDKLPQAQQDKIMDAERIKSDQQAFRMSPFYEQTRMETPTQLKILQERGFDTSTLYNQQGNIDTDKLVLAKLRTDLQEQGVQLTGNETPFDLLELEEEQKRKIIKEMSETPFFQDTINYTGPTNFRLSGGVASPMATGGSAGYQTGGITETRSLPPEFIEAAQKTFLTDLSRQAGIPSITTATTQQPGETAQQFANRQAQAQQFNITRAGMAELAPQVAAQDPLQAAAYAQAIDPTKGLGAFQPFLTKATTAADATTALTGTGAGTGVGSIASYTSPFQQQVIDTTLSEFDKQAKMRQNQLAASALGIPGAFGGGREGVQRAEFDATSDANRARILADLRQRGFQQGQQARQQDLANQMSISQLQSGLGARAQDLSRAQISGLGTLGAQQQAQNQAILDAQRQASAMAVQDPRDRLSMFGQGISGLTPGARTVTLSPTDTATAPGPSPLMTALGVGLAGADIYGRIFGPRK